MTYKFYEKTISTQSIFKGRIIDLEVQDVELPNGEHSKREIIKHPGAVAVIAVTKDKKILLINQFRKPLEKELVEIPAGKLEPGEDPLECAKRELEEETGYRPKDLKLVTSFYTSPGFANELVYIYFTNEMELGEVNCDEDEFLEVIEVTLDEAEELIEKQVIHDAKTVFAIQYLKLNGG
ncbi:ADP-ribose pyrophosphatase [Anaerobacillus alkalilacustris]|uniref:ADP-ribose pyrophosphatase n=1 Tax=Anaerobacillus alkalilacustris TaxID=393763 RepID=A0A1S2LGA5_9BACI|nr:NUDIX hydrolase [Anaerobacillus alkalilacustris]OIJ10737.1 ADP-ribose pyrophosphatase [Anaerobacillus alkalilacustris]